jgi:hypothetical protein
MGQQRTRVEISAYFTPVQAKEIDRLRELEGGISRSAFVRSLFLHQLRWRLWRERVRWRKSRGQDEGTETRGSVEAASAPPQHQPDRDAGEIQAWARRLINDDFPLEEVARRATIRFGITQEVAERVVRELAILPDTNEPEAGSEGRPRRNQKGPEGA